MRCSKHSCCPSKQSPCAQGCCPSKKKPLIILAALAGAAAVVGLMGGCASRRTAQTDLPTVDHVNVERYTGTWYEIAKLPNRFQKQCASNTKAVYAIQGNDISVTNSCMRADGKTEDITGIAKVVPNSGNAKLRVSFFGPFYAPYWILALGPSYDWSLVGTPDRKYLWILSRTPQLPEETQRHVIARAVELGFDTSKLEFTPQTAAEYPRSYSKQP